MPTPLYTAAAPRHALIDSSTRVIGAADERTWAPSDQPRMRPEPLTSKDPPTAPSAPCEPSAPGGQGRAAIEASTGTDARRRRAQRWLSTTRRPFLLVLLVLVLTVPSIPRRELTPTDEPRFALVARQMIEDPAPIVPHLGYDALTKKGEVYADKPPLFFWLISLGSLLTGGVDETSARLPSLVAAIAAVLLTWRVGRLLAGERVGFAGAAILATTSQFFLRAGWCSIDMVLTAFVLAATDSWLRAARARSGKVVARDPVGSPVPLAVRGGLFAAAATLSKGPVGLIFPLAFLAGDRLAARFPRPSGTGARGSDPLHHRVDSMPSSTAREDVRRSPDRMPGASDGPRRPAGAQEFIDPGPSLDHVLRGVPSRAVLAGVIAYLAPIALWLAAIFAIGGSAYVFEILFKQNVTRYVAAWNNQAPWTYYFYRLPIGLLPWTLLLPGAILASRGLPEERARPLRGLAAACAGLFLFFSLSTGKRGVYLLPLYPALAILLAVAWSRRDSLPHRIIARAHVWGLLVGSLVGLAGLPFVRADRLQAGGAAWLLVTIMAVASALGVILERRTNRSAAPARPEALRMALHRSVRETAPEVAAGRDAPTASGTRPPEPALGAPASALSHAPARTPARLPGSALSETRVNAPALPAAVWVHVCGAAAVVFLGSWLLVPAINRNAGVREFGARLAAIARGDDFLVVDQEGYEQILFYSHLRGTRRDFDRTRVSVQGGRIVLDSRPPSKHAKSGADRPAERPTTADRSDRNAGAENPIDPTDAASSAGTTASPVPFRPSPPGPAPGRSLAGEEGERSRAAVRFPLGARVVFVVKGERVDRLRAALGPDGRTLLSGVLSGDPYFVVAGPESRDARGSLPARADGKALAPEPVLAGYSGAAAQSPSGADPSGEEVRYRIDPSRSSVTFSLKATLHTVVGKTSAVSGEFTRPARPGPDGFPVRGRIVIAARTLDTGNGSRDKRMRQESLAVDRFPEIVFVPARAKGTATFEAGTTSSLTLEGELTVRGVTRPVSLAVTSRFNGKGIIADGRTTLAFPDFGVPDPSSFLLRVSTRLEVSFHLEGGSPAGTREPTGGSAPRGAGDAPAGGTRATLLPGP